jgi:hypothetical protein
MLGERRLAEGGDVNDDELEALAWLHAREVERSELLWALQSRVLTDEEMEKVGKMRMRLVIPYNTSYREEDKRRELNEALLQQFRLRAAARVGEVRVVRDGPYEITRVDGSREMVWLKAGETIGAKVAE